MIDKLNDNRLVSLFAVFVLLRSTLRVLGIYLQKENYFTKGKLSHHSVAGDCGHDVHHHVPVLLLVHLVGPVLRPQVI